MTSTNIFVCCRREDLAVVQEIIAPLAKDGRFQIHVDKWHLLPGGAWVKEIDQILDHCTICVFFLGSREYHSGLMATLTERVSERTLHFISVRLPESNSSSFYDLPPLLEAQGYIVFRNVEDDWALRQLEEYIVGQSITPHPSEIRLPVDILGLELLEDYLEQTLLEGDIQEAANIYALQLGGYRHLGWRLGDYERGERLTSLLVEAGGLGLQGLMAVRPAYEQSLFYLDAGKPHLAETKLRELLGYYHSQVRRWQEIRRLIRAKDLDKEQIQEVVDEFARFHRWMNEDAWLMYESAVLQSIGDALVLQGKLVEAEEVATAVIEQVNSGEEEKGYINPSFNPYGRRAIVRFLSGKTALALADFQQGQALAQNPRRREGTSIYQQLWHARCLLWLGKVKTAGSLLQQYRVEQLRGVRPFLAAQYELVMAEYYLASLEDGQAIPVIESALDWSTHSDHKETFMRSNLLKGRYLLRRGNHLEAWHYFNISDEIGRLSHYRLLLIDTFVLQGYAAIYSGKVDEATTKANTAYTLSSEPSCDYRWGIGNATQLLSEIAFRQGDLSQALDWASQTYLTRHEIEDPRLKNTQQLMKRFVQ